MPRAEGQPRAHQAQPRGSCAAAADRIRSTGQSRSSGTNAAPAFITASIPIDHLDPARHQQRDVGTRAHAPRPQRRAT